MKTLIGFIGGLFFTMVICCGDGTYNPSNPNNIRKIDATDMNFAKYIVKYIEYIQSAHTVTGCDDLVIYFTDGTKMRIFINKYTAEIEL
mgnify:CR=1 FL=1